MRLRWLCDVIAHARRSKTISIYLILLSNSYSKLRFLDWRNNVHFLSWNRSTWTITSTKILKNIKTESEVHEMRSKTSRDIFARNSTKSLELSNFLETRRRRAEITTSERIRIEIAKLFERTSLIIWNVWLRNRRING